MLCFLHLRHGFDIINVTCCSNDLCNGSPGEYNVIAVEDKVVLIYHDNSMNKKIKIL